MDLVVAVLEVIWVWCWWIWVSVVKVIGFDGLGFDFCGRTRHPFFI